jgi:exodeoxyribonuclease V alpha subunit
MQKSIHLDCKTIHRALCYIPEQGFTKTQYNQFEENFFVVDETSMLDVEIAEALMEAIPASAKIIFMGDTKQLASVGPGNVLKDLIESNRFTNVTLNVIKRQGLLSGIVKNANRIIAKEQIQSEPETGDFFVINASEENKIKDTVVESIRRLLQKNYEFDNIQVLVPQRTGALGVNAFNYLLQQKFNPIIGNETRTLKTTFSIKGNPFELYFHKGDKVIHMKNDYNMKNYEKVAGRYLEIKESSGITNGECGVVEEVIQNGSSTTTVVRYENFYCQYEDVSDLELAYATTIHKSQGSQWEAIIVLNLNQHSYMLSNNILYTGITRAKDFCCVIGPNSAIDKAINTNKDDGRYTSLAEILLRKD